MKYSAFVLILVLFLSCINVNKREVVPPVDVDMEKGGAYPEMMVDTTKNETTPADVQAKEAEKISTPPASAKGNTSSSATSKRSSSATNKRSSSATNRYSSSTTSRRSSSPARQSDNMRGFDPAFEDDMDDNGMSRYMENNDDEGWD